MSIEAISYPPEEPSEPTTESVTIAVSDLIGVQVPLGIERVTRIAVQALRSSEAVVSYCTEDCAQNFGRPLRIQRCPQA